MPSDLHRLTAAGLCWISGAALLAAQADEDPLLLEPLQVTVGRFDAQLALVPATIDVADRDLLRAAAAANVAEALEDMGVLFRSFTGSPAQASIDMRGFGETGNLNVLVLVDGRRINAPDMSGINWLDLPLASVDRIEVIRGAQSALYGNNAAGGVISITTRVPDAPGAVALAGVSSWGGRVARAGAWSPVGSVRVRGEAGYEKSDGYRDNRAYEMAAASATLAGGSAVQWRITAGGSDTSTRYPGPLSHADFIEIPRRSGYSAEILMPDGRWVSMKEFYGSETQTLSTTASVDARRADWEAHADAGFRRRDLSWNLGPRLRWGGAERSLTLGGDLEYDTLSFQRYAQMERTDQTGDAELDRWTAGAYLHGLAGASGGLSLTGTLRGQWHGLDADIREPGRDAVAASSSGSDIAASAGATWSPRESLRLWLRGDRFFRYPALDEVAAFQGYALPQTFNHNLKSERGWGAEAGAELGIHGAVLRLTAFAQDVERLIAFGPDPASPDPDYPDYLNVNIGDGYRAGLEAALQFRSRHWSAGLLYTLLYAGLTGGEFDGRDLYLVPRHQASAQVTWMPMERGSLRLSVRHTGSQWQGNDLGNERQRMPAYTVADVLARIAVGRGLHVYAGVDNVLDRRYAALLYSGGWYPAAARAYRVGLQWDF